MKYILILFLCIPAAVNSQYNKQAIDILAKLKDSSYRVTNINVYETIDSSGRSLWLHGDKLSEGLKRIKLGDLRDIEILAGHLQNFYVLIHLRGRNPRWSTY